MGIVNLEIVEVKLQLKLDDGYIETISFPSRKSANAFSYGFERKMFECNPTNYYKMHGLGNNPVSHLQAVAMFNPMEMAFYYNGVNTTLAGVAIL